MCRYLLLLIAGILFCRQLAGQPVIQSSFRLSETLLESLASGDAASGDFESLLNELDNLRSNPVDLNTCSREDLDQLPFLTEFQINSLLEYIKEKGKLLSVYELQAVIGYSDEVISMMIPFVTVSDGSVQTQNKSFIPGRHELSFRSQRILEKSRGYSVYDPVTKDTRYPGSPWYLNARYNYSSANLSAGITLEKDAGEELFRGSNRAGFDFNSAHLLFSNIGRLKSVVIGDYRLAFGQGLTLWSGTAPGKSSLPMNIVKRQDAIKAYNSNDENNYFRGFAARAALGRFTLTGFFSSNRRDANITDTVDRDHINFSSFQESGYHRTSSEIADENSIRETAAGANLIFRNNYMKLGSTLASYRFDKFLEKGNELRDIHEYEGNKLVNLGIDYSVVLKNIQFFGETSYGNKSLATLNGILLNTGKYASFSLLYRNFPAGFFSLHSSAFSESADDFNEEGLYAGIQLHPVKGLKISGYADFYRFPWLKSAQSRPASGNDFMVQADFTLKKGVEMYLRLKFESDPRDVTADSSVIPDILETEHSGIRYHIRYKTTDRLIMQDRLELSRSGPSKGYLIYHDISYSLASIPVELDLRLAWFDTDDYESRLYAYEQDITAGYSFSPLFDSGFRGYFMAAFAIMPGVKGSVRYSSTWFPRKNTIGSGYDEISGQSRNDIKIRLSFMF